MSAIQPGDIMIRRSSGSESFELHDAVSGELLVTSQTLRAALDLAMSRGCGVAAEFR
jgi:hypothetical protein